MKPRPLLPHPLDRRHGLLRAMGALGWDAPIVLKTDVAVVADFLGHGVVGQEWDQYDPVIRGSRGLVLPKDVDSDDTPSGQPTQQATDHVQSVTGLDRRALYAQAREGVDDGTT